MNLFFQILIAGLICFLIQVVFFLASALYAMRQDEAEQVSALWMMHMGLNAIAFFGYTVFCLLFDVFEGAVIGAAATGYCAWAFFDERKKRKRRGKKSRVLGLVREVGGKLRVIPDPAR